MQLAAISQYNFPEIFGRLYFTDKLNLVFPYEPKNFDKII